MKKAIKIDLTTGYVVLNDGSKKTLDNYVLELEDKLDKVYEELKEYSDVNAWETYKVDGVKLFNIMDILEDK